MMAQNYTLECNFVKVETAEYLLHSSENSSSADEDIPQMYMSSLPVFQVDTFVSQPRPDMLVEALSQNGESTTAHIIRHEDYYTLETPLKNESHLAHHVLKHLPIKRSSNFIPNHLVIQQSEQPVRFSDIPQMVKTRDESLLYRHMEKHHRVPTKRKAHPDSAKSDMRKRAPLFCCHCRKIFYASPTKRISKMFPEGRSVINHQCNSGHHYNQRKQYVIGVRHRKCKNIHSQPCIVWADNFNKPKKLITKNKFVRNEF